MKHLLDDPLAKTSSGLLVANVTHTSQAKNPKEALAAAMKSGRKVLIAIQLTKEETAKATFLLDEAAEEAVDTLCSDANSSSDDRQDF